MFYKAMPVEPPQFHKLASVQGMICRWRTRPTPEGWEAQCEAGPDKDSSITWMSKGATEQAALDRAIDHAWDYWNWKLKLE